MNEMIQKTLADSDCLIHQYTRSAGHLRLVNGIANCYGKFLNRNINPLNEVLITCGAYGSLFNSLNGLIEKDDEVCKGLKQIRWHTHIPHPFFSKIA